MWKNGLDIQKNINENVRVTMRFCTLAHSDDWYIARFDCGFIESRKLNFQRLPILEYSRMFLYFAYQLFSNMYVFNSNVMWLVYYMSHS